MVAKIPMANDVTPPAINKVMDDLAYRTPGSNKPLGHIVLPREHAERLVDEYSKLYISLDKLWDSLHKFYIHVKPDCPPSAVPEMPEHPRFPVLERAANDAFMAMCAYRDSRDDEVFQDAIDALGLALLKGE